MKLFKHQEEALKKTEGFSRCAFYHEMGLGKTFTGAEKMMSLGSSTNLVICQKSKVQDWEEHFLTQYDENVWTYDLTTKDELEWFLDEVWNDNKIKVGIINYELAWRRPELTKLKDFTLMLDESSLICNPKAKQSKFIMKKLHPANVILLSGTICGGKYENLWSQAKMLGWDISEDTFYKHYINYQIVDYGRVKYKKVDKENPYKNIDRLKDKFRSFGADFVKTEEVFDLPDQMFTTISVPTSKEYKKFKKDHYIHFINELHVEDALDPEDTDEVELVGDTSLTQLLYERQLCGCYSEAKIEAFQDILDGTNDRLIVFYNFDKELELMESVTSRPPSWVNGKHKDLTNYETKEDSITFVQYQAGAMGLNLQKANKIIYFSLPLSSDLFEQSKKRIHRIGQNQPCFYYTMICKNSVEEQIQKTLNERMDFTNELFKSYSNE